MRPSHLRFVLQPLSTLIALVICLCSPTPISAQTDFENEYQSDYADIRWSTTITKEQVIGGEQFDASVDLISDIKQIRGDAVRILSTLVNPLSPDAVVTWEVIAQKDDSANKISLGTYQVRKPLPKLEVGGQLEFRNERIPAEGSLIFPDYAETGKYALYLRFIKVEAKASVLLATLSRNITEVTQDYLPPETYGSGIRLGEIDLINPLPAGITQPRVIAVIPNHGTFKVPVDTHIEVTFNEPVDPNSSQQAFSISPETPGQIIWKDNILIFTPRKNLSYNTLYKVSLADDITDMTGVSLITAYSWEFTTEPASSRWWIFWSAIGGAVAVGSIIGLVIIRVRRRQNTQQ